MELSELAPLALCHLEFRIVRDEIKRRHGYRPMCNLPLFVLMNPVWTWLHRFGGPGLILLGIADNSAIPLPGSVDVFLILLAAHHRAWWPYYGCMATVGGVVGGYLSYRLALKGGKGMLQKKLGREKAERLDRRFQTDAFATVSIAAVLPPPFPMVPVLMAAGALQYPPKKFLAALAVGRGVRYFTIAYLARLYGTVIIAWLGRYYRPLLYALIGSAIAGAAIALWYLKWHRRRHKPEGPQAGKSLAELASPASSRSRIKKVS